MTASSTERGPGDIDIVFFGPTSTEMWYWRDRGRTVWDRTFGSFRAESFGSQGTSFASLPWRVRNGELDGYQAKLVVLQALGTGDEAIPGDRRAELVAGYAAVIAEIRARQPRAKILLFAAFPRGRLRREPWRDIARANGADIPRARGRRERFSTSTAASAFSVPTGPSTPRCGALPE
jgi:hypothetical protein